jgi:DNA-binding transcriptional regulator YiaG
MSATVDLQVVRKMLSISKEKLAKRLEVSTFELDFMERRGTLSDSMAERLANVVKNARRAEVREQARRKPSEDRS